MKSSRKKYAKLRGRARALASKYVAEEVATGKYPRKQAVAIGLSRARKKVKSSRDPKKSTKSSRTVKMLRSTLDRY